MLQSNLKRSITSRRFHQRVNEDRRGLVETLESGDTESGDTDTAAQQMHEHLSLLRPVCEKLWRYEERGSQHPYHWGDAIEVTQTNAMQFIPIPGAERLVGLHAAELPQKDGLCGAFWGTLAFRLAGMTLEGAEVDQDGIGLEAGAILSAGEPEPLPYGDPGRRDYRATFPTIEDSALSGTSAVGLVHALRELSGDSAAIIPIAGPWTPAAVRAVLDATEVCGEPCTLIANIATRHLWGSRTGPHAAFSYLVTGDDGAGEEPDWDVGHFVGLLGRIDGPKGTLVVVGDTYRVLGWQGVHLQPVERLARAFDRTGTGRPSGAIIVASPQDGPEVERVLLAAGLELDVWDNGTPYRVSDAA
ncbi:MAG: DUF6885 family protein [Solirubrobacteraceae bacterium]